MLGAPTVFAEELLKKAKVLVVLCLRVGVGVQVGSRPLLSCLPEIPPVSEHPRNTPFVAPIWGPIESAPEQTLSLAIEHEQPFLKKTLPFQKQVRKFNYEQRYPGRVGLH